jgi:hypothetical protein
MPERIHVEELPAAPRALAEVLAQALDLTQGHARIEIEYRDGELTVLWKHERFDRLELDRLNRLSPETLVELLRERVEYYSRG